jgi:hypothetical protein
VTAPLADRRRQISLARLKCRHEAEADSGEHAERGREGENEAVDVDLVRTGQQSRWGHCHQRAHAGHGQRDAYRTTEARQQNALGEQLPDEARSVGAERDAHCHFMPARRGAHQQQVGNVGAGDEQHERHCSGKDVQRPLDVANNEKRNWKDLGHEMRLATEVGRDWSDD